MHFQILMIILSVSVKPPQVLLCLLIVIKDLCKYDLNADCLIFNVLVGTVLSVLLVNMEILPFFIWAEVCVLDTGLFSFEHPLQWTISFHSAANYL